MVLLQALGDSPFWCLLQHLEVPMFLGWWPSITWTFAFITEPLPLTLALLLPLIRMLSIPWVHLLIQDNLPILKSLVTYAKLLSLREGKQFTGLWIRTWASFQGRSIIQPSTPPFPRW